MASRALLFVPIVSAMWMTSACSLLEPPERPLRTYALAAPIDVALQSRRSEVTIAVSVPKAHAGFDTPRMAYVRRPYALDYYAHSQWVDTPARMLQPLLIRALAASSAFNAVVGMPSSTPPQVRLDTDIIHIQQEFVSTPARMRITLRAQLVDEVEHRVIATQVFSGTKVTPSQDAYGGVTAANKLLRELVTQLVDFSIAGLAKDER